MNKKGRGVLVLQDDPRGILGVPANASDEEIRAAYLKKVKEHPPERSPAAFERIRDAYDVLRDPRRRAFYFLRSVNPEAPFVSLLAGRPLERRFVGPTPWLAALREK